MNILHIINGFVSSKLYKAFVEHLSVNIEEQTVFVPIRSNEQKGGNATKVTNIKIVYALVATKLIYRALFFLKISKSIKVLQKEIDIDEFSIIHAHTLFSDGAVAYKLKKKYNIPYIVTLRNTDLNEFFKYLFYLRKLGIDILLNSEKIVFLSEAYKQRLFDNYIPEKYKKALESKSVIIPNGIDDYWLNNINNSKKEIDIKEVRLLFTGEIRKNKNIIGVIQAIESLSNINIKYTIVGEGLNDEGAYLQQIKEMVNSNSNIELLAAVPKEELIVHYRNADIFIMPSFTETFGLVYAEALSQGLPVIYSKNEGFDKTFTEGEVGISVNPKNINDISKAIFHIIDNYSSIQQKCIKASKKFSWESIAEVYLQNYSEIQNRSNNAN